MPLQSKDRANVVFCYHPHFEADFSAFSGAAVPEMRILPDCERFFLITRTSSPQCGNKRLCQSTWLFCFSNILKIYALSPIFPPAGSVVGGFYWLFLCNFKEIKHQPFSMAQPNKKNAGPANEACAIWMPFSCLPLLREAPLSAASRAPGPSSDPSC